MHGANGYLATTNKRVKSMPFSDIIQPRPEVLRKDGIEGVIDIENLRDQKKHSIESRPEDFFDLTFPTTDVRLVLDNLHRRFSSSERTPGLFLFEGLKGSGKSHLELLVYHLFANHQIAKGWLKKHGIECSVPQDATITIHKFTDFPLDSIWRLVFEKLGVERGDNRNKLPNLDELRSALGGKRLVLILDELEMGIQSIANDHIRTQNLSFLQMLSEEGSRSDTASVTLLASVYDANREPGSTLKRVPRIDIKFTEPLDRQQIVLHRLFSNAQSVDRSKVETVVRSYANAWKKAGIGVQEKQVESFVRSYPFTPDLLEMLLHRVLQRDFQGNRGPLGLLGAVVRNTYKKADVISTAHLDISDNSIRNRLVDLDPGQHLLQCAQSDLKILENQPHCKEIIASTLFATLASSGKVKGISSQVLITEALKPGDDQNVLQGTLQALERFGSYFQRVEGNYLFDTQEKPYAKVEYHSLRVDASDARDHALYRWKTNVFGDTNAVIFRDAAQTRTALAQLDKNTPRFVLAPRRLVDEERREIYHGTENRNQIILLEPRSETFNALEHPDLVKWAQLSKAANDLQVTATEAERKRQYEKIASENIRFIDEAFKKAGVSYVSVHVTSSGSPLTFELESLGSATTRQDILIRLQQEFHPAQRFEDHMLECLQDERRELLLERSVAEVKGTYKKTLGFPVFTTETILTQALIRLCKERKIGLHNARTRHCGSTPSFTGSEWNEAILVEPFIEETSGLPLPPGALPIPSGGSSPAPTPAGRPDEPGIPSPDEIPVYIQTPNETSLNQLRQRVAEKLVELTEPKITKARLVVYLQNPSVELGTLPSALRGSLAGLGEINCEIDIQKQGSFGKAQIEQMVEQLPTFPGAYYRAELKGFAKNSADQH